MMQSGSIMLSATEFELELCSSVNKETLQQGDSGYDFTQRNNPFRGSKRAALR